MGNKREVIGVVVRDKVDKGVIVAVERRVRDAVYGKIRRRTTRFMAHDESNSAKVGDRVVMVESRPLSRRKRFIVSRVVERDDAVAAPQQRTCESAQLTAPAAPAVHEQYRRTLSEAPGRDSLVPGLDVEPLAGFEEGPHSSRSVLSDRCEEQAFREPHRKRRREGLQSAKHRPEK